MQWGAKKSESVYSYASIHPSIHLSIPIHPSIQLSIYLSNLSNLSNLSIYLSNYSPLKADQKMNLNLDTAASQSSNSEPTFPDLRSQTHRQGRTSCRATPTAQPSNSSNLRCQMSTLTAQIGRQWPPPEKLKNAVQKTQNLSINLSNNLSTNLSIHPSIHLSLPIHPFIQLSTKKQTQDQSSGRHSDGAGCAHRNSSILRCKNKNITELTYQCKNRPTNAGQRQHLTKTPNRKQPKTETNKQT